MTVQYARGSEADTDTFADFMQRERDRIHAERERILIEQTALEAHLHSLNREMQAIDAYEAAKAGKLPTQVSRGARIRANRQARQGSKRNQIVELVTANPQGLGRGELLNLIGIKGDKGGEMSVSNALTALVKNHTLARNVDKKYVLAA